MSLSQTDRLIRIDTALGPDAFIVLSFTGHEQISELFSFQLQLASQINDITFDRLAGKTVTVAVRSSDGSQRYFNGIIVEFSPGLVSEQEGYSTYSAVMAPAVWTLKQCYDCRIFQDKTVPDIIARVLSQSELGRKQVRQIIDFRMDVGEYAPRQYCVQYNESDLDFMARLCEEEGICYFFEHEKDRHSLVFADSPDKHHPCNTGKKQSVNFQRSTGSVTDAELISDLNHRYTMASATFVARDFNFKLPHNDLTVQQAAMQHSAHDVGERYEYPGGYEKTLNRGQQIAAIRMQERDAQVCTISGKSNCRGFCAGFRFTLEQYPLKSMNGKDYLLTRLDHKARQQFIPSADGAGDSYENQFAGIAHQTRFRPPRKTARPVIAGVQTAMVTGPAGEEIHTDEYGRVKVHFAWDRLTDTSCWIRVSQGWAGAGWGAMHIPRVGQEVIVSFIEGDPDRPIITGRVYNSANTAAYSLPAEKTKSTIISSSTPGGNGSNELRFEDKAGSEEIYLHGQKDWAIAIENDKSQSVGNNETMTVTANRTKSVGADQSETIGKNKTITVGGSHNETIGADMTVAVAAGRTVTIGANDNQTVAGKSSQQIGGSQSVHVSGSAAETVNIAKALTIGGAYQISVGAAMNETVVGLKAEQVGVSKSVNVIGNFSETVGQGHKLKAKTVEIEADEQITFKTGSATITMTSDGKITLKGTEITQN